MENQDQNSLVSFGDGAGTENDGTVHEAPLEVNSLSAQPEAAEVLISQQQFKASPVSRFFKFARRLDVVLVALLVIGGAVMLFVLTRNEQPGVGPAANADEFGAVQIPLQEIVSGKDLTIQGGSNVTINGQLQLGDALYLTPQLQPTGAKAGQIYFDSATNQLAYYNGETFVFLTSPSVTPGDLQTLTRVESIGGLSGEVGLGDGLAAANGQLSNAGVLSFQGQTGNVTLTAGVGLLINGTTLSSSGVLSVTAGTSNVTIGNDGSGNITVSVEEPTMGTGTVTSSGGTAGTVPVLPLRKISRIPSLLKVV